MFVKGSSLRTDPSIGCTRFDSLDPLARSRWSCARAPTSDRRNDLAVPSFLAIRWIIESVYVQPTLGIVFIGKTRASRISDLKARRSGGCLPFDPGMTNRLPVDERPSMLRTVDLSQQVHHPETLGSDDQRAMNEETPGHISLAVQPAALPTRETARCIAIIRPRPPTSTPARAR